MDTRGASIGSSMAGSDSLESGGRAGGSAGGASLSTWGASTAAWAAGFPSASAFTGIRPKAAADAWPDGCTDDARGQYRKEKAAQARMISAGMATLTGRLPAGFDG